jgi:hypothetical protein
MLTIFALRSGGKLAQTDVTYSKSGSAEVALAFAAPESAPD